MQDNTFKFYFKSDNDTYYKIVNGDVQLSTQKSETIQCVADWKQAQISFKRSELYWSAFREFSIPMKFVLNGAKILRHIFYNEGFTGNCIFYIEKLNTTSRAYEYWYDGNVDFSQTVDDENFFQINLLERGLIGLIKNREDTEYEIELSGPDVIDGRLDGVKLGAKSRWIMGDSTADFSDFPAIEHGTGSLMNFGDGCTLPAMPIGDDIQAGSFIIPREERLKFYTGPSPDPDSLDYVDFPDGASFGKATSDWYNLKFSGSLQMMASMRYDGPQPINPQHRIDVYIGVVDASGTRIVSQNTKIGESPLFPNDTFTEFIIPLSGNIDQVSLDSKVVVYVKFFNFGTSSDLFEPRIYFFTDNSILNMNYQARVGATNYPALRHIDLFKRLINKVTDGVYTAQSNFLSNTNSSSTQRNTNYDNSPYNTVVTSGDGLRGISNAKIKTSVKQYFSDGWSRWVLCLSVEGNTVRMEPLSYYFNDDVILHFDLINNVTVKPYSERIINEVSFGYGNYDNNNVEGKNEFNTGLDFLIKANTVVKKKEENISPYRADVYGIESVRAETFDEDKKDNRSDNDTFIIEVAPTPVSGFYLPYRTDPSGITGVDDPVGIYNLGVSPGRSTRRHIPRIRSIVRKGILQYQTTDKNDELISDMGSGLVEETADIDLTLDTMNGRAVLPLFSAYVLELDCVPNYRLAEILQLQSSGCISFNYNNTTFKGFILDVGCTPATNEKYRFRLLSHPTNDLSKLIH